MKQDTRFSRDLLGVALTGSIAAGKTTVAETVSEILHKRQMRHALLDVDWLGQLYPPPNADDPFSLALAFKNLELVVPNFIDAGARYFVIALTLTSEKELQALRSAIPQVELTVCLLTASPETRLSRIASRHSAKLREDFLQRTDVLAEQIESASLHDLCVCNDEKPLEDVAAHLLHSLGWVSR